MIELKSVSKSFVDGRTSVDAIKNINLSISKGDIFGIIGFSGAGKSTLLRCINLLEVPDSGQVLVNNLDITNLRGRSLRDIRKNIGMIFQHFNLFPSRTIFENVAYPLGDSGLSDKEIEKRVHYLLELVGIQEKAKTYPSQLSGGQKQRVAIARALATEPDILLCDEATSSLDPQTTHSILKLLKQLNKTLNLTIVLITHEMEVVKEICNRVAIMDSGEIVEESDIFSIFSNPQTNLGKKFINTTSNLYKIHQLVNQECSFFKLGDDEIIVRLTYLQPVVSEPLISYLSQRYEVTLNIIFADIDVIQGFPIGGTVAILKGNGESVEEAIRYLESKNVGIEVISDVR